MPQAQQRHISGQRQAPVPTGNDTTNSFRIHEISVASNDRALFLTADAAMTNSSPADVELNIADPSENSPFQRASNSPAEASVLSNDDYSAKTPLQGVSGIGVHPVVLSCKNLTCTFHGINTTGAKQSHMNEPVLQKGTVTFPIGMQFVAYSTCEQVILEGNCFATCLKRWRGCRKVNTSESSVNTGVSRSHQKEILCFEGLELVFNPGDCVALMGSSGAGKSTLLNCLAGRVSEGLNGEVFLNDKPITRQLCKELSSFIQQEDVLFGYLTMEEHLYFQARLRLPKGSSAEEARRAANHLLESFGLAHIAKSFIGGPREGARGSISGGEKKRLCVATELLSNPSIIFADEPTSGLDSFMAKAVCDQLSLLATAGCTVVCTIHQPSSSCFAMFNKVLLIGEGRVLYYGDRLASVSWLEHLGCQTCGVDTNPAEFLMKATALQHLDPQAKTNRLKEWAEAWKVEGQQFLNNWVTLRHCAESRVSLRLKD